MSDRAGAILNAENAIDAYAATIKGQLQMTVTSYERDHPGWTFDHLDVKFDEKLNQYSFTPIFKKVK